MEAQIQHLRMGDRLSTALICQEMLERISNCKFRI
jgi:hypothetical protein